MLLDYIAVGGATLCFPASDEESEFFIPVLVLVVKRALTVMGLFIWSISLSSAEDSSNTSCRE